MYIPTKKNGQNFMAGKEVLNTFVSWELVDCKICIFSVRSGPGTELICGFRSDEWHMQRRWQRVCVTDSAAPFCLCLCVRLLKIHAPGLRVYGVNESEENWAKTWMSWAVTGKELWLAVVALCKSFLFKLIFSPAVGFYRTEIADVLLFFICWLCRCLHGEWRERRWKHS